MKAKKEKKITRIEPVRTTQSLEKTQIKRVCAYCRVSTDSEDQRHSFDSQVAYYNRMIGERNNWIFSGIYADEDRSGTKMNGRDEFQKMMQNCRRRQHDYIITKSVTRFARNTVDSIQAIRELKALGIGVYFEKERVDTLSEKSEQLLTILSSIAQGESENTSTNVRWSVVRRFQNGTFIISEPAYGYCKDPDGNLIIEPKEAAVVRRIFEAYLGGMGSYAIARSLQEERIPTSRKSNGWQEGSVKEILKNPVYEGDLLLQKTCTTEGVPFRKKRNHGELPQYLMVQKERVALETPKYRKLTRQIEELLQMEEFSAEEIKTLLYERAMEQYQSMEIQSQPYYAEQMAEILCRGGKQEQFNEGCFQKTVEKIMVFKNGTMDVHMRNGVIIQIKENGEEGSSDAGKCKKEHICHTGKASL